LIGFVLRAYRTLSRIHWITEQCEPSLPLFESCVQSDSDHVIEVGGAGTLERSIRATRLGGTISMIGVLAGLEGSINPLPLLTKALRLQGISVGPRHVFEAMNRAVTAHTLRPVIDRVFPFDKAREAMHYLESGAHFGKIIVRL
jgi:NADPH:quinone reductase-like Zn-dependent oxidoreductase